MAETNAQEPDPAEVLERRVTTMTRLTAIIAQGHDPSRQPGKPGYIVVDDADEDLLNLAARLHTVLGYDFNGKTVKFLASALDCMITAMRSNADPCEALGEWIKAHEDTNYLLN